MLQKKLIIFDFDGVIYDVSTLQMQRIINSAQSALECSTDKGILPHEKFLKAYWGMSITDMSQLFVDKLNWTLDQAKLFLDYEKNNNGFFPNGLASGYNELILKLKNAGINVAICSNRYTHSFYPLIKNLQVPEKDFEFIILGDTLKNGVKKPDKRVLDPVFIKYNKEEVVLIGDTLRSDFQTAVNANIDFIGISSILHSQHDFTRKFKTHVNGSTFLVLNEFKQLSEVLDTKY
jgi:phosphoglycolate phosphatase-like HAD superfamily hydrolase